MDAIERAFVDVFSTDYGLTATQLVRIFRLHRAENRLRVLFHPRAARSCGELLSLYSARPTLSTISTASDKSPALSTTMRMCDYSVQFYNAEEALIRRVEAPDNPCVRMRDALDRLKDTHGRTLIDRIGSCHAAAVDPGRQGGNLILKLKAGAGAFEADYQAVPRTPIFEIQPCEEVRASLVRDVPYASIPSIQSAPDQEEPLRLFA